MSDNNAYQQAVAQASNIIEMVAALNCDYDRLEELKEERDNFESDEVGNLASAEVHKIVWAQTYPEDAEELAKLESEANGNDNEEQAREAIQNDPLSVEYRSGWANVGETLEATEFMILLCTGGPAVRIVGELDDNTQPSRAWIEYQDWFQPWQEAVNVIDQDVLLEYCRVHWFGE